MASASAAARSAGQFERYRKELLGLAYRMLGSLAEAEDIVQDAWMRWQGADRSAVGAPRAPSCAGSRRASASTG
jgi:RNA polymerase sigma-70 factor (ECF subfamily)